MKYMSSHTKGALSRLCRTAAPRPPGRGGSGGGDWRDLPPPLWTAPSVGPDGRVEGDGAALRPPSWAAHLAPKDRAHVARPSAKGFGHRLRDYRLRAEGTEDAKAAISAI